MWGCGHVVGDRERKNGRGKLGKGAKPRGQWVPRESRARAWIYTAQQRIHLEDPATEASMIFKGAGFLLGLLFNPEDEGGVSFRYFS
jgi:hypothetical protein